MGGREGSARPGVGWNAPLPFGEVSAPGHRQVVGNYSVYSYFPQNSQSREVLKSQLC